MSALCLSLLVVFQEPPPPEPPPAPPVVAPAATVEEWTDEQAKAAVGEFRRQMKGKRLELRDRVEAIERIAKGRNDALVRPLAETVADDGPITVRKLAADALGNQPAQHARPAILRLLRDSNLHKLPQIQASLVAALDRVGYEAKDWSAIDGLFERGYEQERVPLQKCLIQLVANNKEKKALDLLLDHLGEPIPENVDDPANPPAEYWEARWKAWQVWREDVKTALFEITGQRFSTPKEAKVWLKKNGDKIR
jgi:hypothetical protein